MKTLRFKSIAIAAALFFAGTSISFAQHDHGSQGQSQSQSHEMKAPESPHGGMVQIAGKYQIELVVNMMQKEDKVTVYLLNKNGKTIPNSGVTGTAMFMFDDGSSITESLVAKGDNRFVAQLEGMKSFTTMVSLEVKGKTIGANFQHKGMEGHDGASSFSCPMHSEVVASAPGNCPKCGMTLKKT